MNNTLSISSATFRASTPSNWRTSPPSCSPSPGRTAARVGVGCGNTTVLAPATPSPQTGDGCTLDCGSCTQARQSVRSQQNSNLEFTTRYIVSVGYSSGVPPIVLTRKHGRCSLPTVKEKRKEGQGEGRMRR